MCGTSQKISLHNPKKVKQNFSWRGEWSLDVGFQVKKALCEGSRYFIVCFLMPTIYLSTLQNVMLRYLQQSLKYSRFQNYLKGGEGDVLQKLCLLLNS